jgi:hypothetical protein
LPSKHFDSTLEALVARLLAKDPASRFRSFENVMEDLASLLQQKSDSIRSLPSPDNTNKPPLAVSAAETQETSPKEKLRAGGPSIKADQPYITWQQSGLVTIALVILFGGGYLAYQRLQAGTQSAKGANVVPQDIKDSLTTAGLPAPARDIVTVKPNSYSTLLPDGSRVFVFPQGLNLGMLAFENQQGKTLHYDAKGAVVVPSHAFLLLNAGEKLFENPGLFGVFTGADLKAVCLEPDFNWNEKHLKQISRLTSLNKLLLDSLELDATCLDDLNKLTVLTNLDIPNCKTNQKTILRLTRLNQLNSLNADTIENMDLVIEELKKSKCMNDLSLQSCKLNDESLDKISQITSLKTLKVGENQAITSAGIEHLLNMPELHTLDVEGVQLDPKCITLLKRFKKLTFLRISTGKWTISQKSELQAALPKCQIN